VSAHSSTTPTPFTPLKSISTFPRILSSVVGRGFRRDSASRQSKDEGTSDYTGEVFAFKEVGNMPSQNSSLSDSAMLFVRKSTTAAVNCLVDKQMDASPHKINVAHDETEMKHDVIPEGEEGREEGGQPEANRGTNEMLSATVAVMDDASDASEEEMATDKKQEASLSEN